MKTKYPLGTISVPRPRAGRLVSFLRFLGWLIAGGSLVVGILAVVQLAFHPFDALLATVQRDLGEADRKLQANAIAGVSLGSVVLVLAVAALPLFQRGVRKRQYALSFWRGLLSAAIFLATNRIYLFVQRLGVLYFSATVALFVAATIVLVEVVSRAGRAETESETRTELLASIVSGLVFGLLVQFAGHLVKR